MFPNKRRLQPLSWIKGQRYAARPQITAVNSLVSKFVERISLPLCPFPRDAQVNPIINNGKIDHSFEATLVVIAKFARCHRLELIGRLGRYQIDNARGRISSVERALGAT